MAANNKIEQIIKTLKETYQRESICMAELLASEKAEGLSFEEVIYVYETLKDWADGTEDDLRLQKITAILERFFNLFHTDLILRAIHNPSVSLNDFKQGIVAINVSEARTDDDEFVPTEFAGV